MGDFYQIAETEDIIYIGTDLPNEYSGSNYTKHIKGTIAKAKAIPEMNEIATAKTHEDNRKNKHSRQAKNGWYRYDTRFALPVYGENGDIERYNVFSARLLIRHDSSVKMYLFDVLEIKKVNPNIRKAVRRNGATFCNLRLGVQKIIIVAAYDVRRNSIFVREYYYPSTTKNIIKEKICHENG